MTATKRVSYETTPGVIKRVMSFDNYENGLTGHIGTSNRSKYGQRYALRIGIGKSSRATFSNGKFTLPTFVPPHSQLTSVNRIMEAQTGYIFYHIPGHDEYGLMNPVSGEKSFTVPHGAANLILPKLEEILHLGMVLFYSSIESNHAKYLSKEYVESK
jgi:hypothetical protein